MLLFSKLTSGEATWFYVETMWERLYEVFYHNSGRQNPKRKGWQYGWRFKSTVRLLFPFKPLSLPLPLSYFVYIQNCPFYSKYCKPQKFLYRICWLNLIFSQNCDLPNMVRQKPIVGAHIICDLGHFNSFRACFKICFIAQKKLQIPTRIGSF